MSPYMNMNMDNDGQRRHTAHTHVCFVWQVGRKENGRDTKSKSNSAQVHQLSSDRDASQP